MLHVMAVRPPVVAGEERRERVRRLGPVDACDHDQQDADGDGQQDECAISSHGGSLAIYPTGRRGPVFHRLHEWLWKCGKLNNAQIAAMAFLDPLRRPAKTSRLPSAPSTERK